MMMMDLSRVAGTDGASLERADGAVDEPGWIGLRLTLPPQQPLHLSVRAQDAATIIASHILNTLCTHDPKFQHWQDSRRSKKRWRDRRDDIADEIHDGVEAVMCRLGPALNCRGFQKKEMSA